MRVWYPCTVTCVSLDSRALFLALVLGLVPSAGCDAKQETKPDVAAPAAEPAHEAEAPAKAADVEARPEPDPVDAAEAGRPQVGASIELEAVTDDALGYRIELPKGSKVLQKDDELGVHTYSMVFADGMHELNTHITTTTHPDLASLEARVGESGPRAVDGAEELEGGKLRVHTKELEVFGVEVWVALKGKALEARCSGPAEHRSDLARICSSIESTR